MRASFCTAIVASLLAGTASGIIDTNNNGFSDLWERDHNAGELFAAGFLPGQDPDKDGWNNAQEAAAGTDPFDPNPPDGLVRPEITHHEAVFSEPDEFGNIDIISPEAMTVSWPTVPGKRYRILVSTELTETSWQQVDAFVASGISSQVTALLGAEDGTETLFWRIAVEDTDTDGDGLSDAEEFEIGSSRYFADTDDDGISDADEYHAGTPPQGDGSDGDGDGVPDDELYGIVFETRHESRSQPYVGYEPFDGPLDVMYLTKITKDRYAVSNSPNYPDITFGETVETETVEQNGEFVDPTVTGTTGTTFSDWKSANELELGEGEHVVRQDDVSNIQTNAGVVFKERITTTTTPWDIEKDEEAVRSGSEEIQITKREELEDVLTVQELWRDHLLNETWMSDSDDPEKPTRYGPLSFYNFDFSSASMNEAETAGMIRKDYKVWRTNLGAGLCYLQTGTHAISSMDQRRLKTLRWRWVRFNPNNPFEYEFSAPPQAMKKTLVFSLYQTDTLIPTSVYPPQADIVTAETKGLVAIECKGTEGGSDWQEVDLELFESYQLNEPKHLDQAHFSKAAWSQVDLRQEMFDVVSRDKFLAGSIEIPSGWDDVSINFANTTTQEDLGTYSGLMGGGSTKIYESIEAILDEEDVEAGSQPASQQVWFIRDAQNPRKLDFYTCFNGLGEVDIRLTRSGQEPSVLKHTLTAAADFADTIRYVDDWVKGVGFNLGSSGGGGGTIPLAMMSSSASGPGQESIDPLTRAALIPFFVVVDQVEGMGSVLNGLFDGVRKGLDDDYMFLAQVLGGLADAGDYAAEQILAELEKWRNPIIRAGELKNMAMQACKDWVYETMRETREDLSTWEGFKNASWRKWQSIQGKPSKAWTVTKTSWNGIVTSMIDWGDDFLDRMMTGAEKAHFDAVPWVRTELQQEINQAYRQACYTFGYTFGYLSEQVGIGLVSAGAGKLAQVAAKGGLPMAQALAKRTAANVAARAHFLKRLLAEATKLPDDLVAAYQRGFAVASTGPTGEGFEQCAMHMMQVAADAGRLVWRDYVNGIVGKTNIRQFVKQGRNHIIERQFARLTHILGDEFTEQLGKSFLKVADEFILVKQGDDSVDDFFEAFFKAFEGNPSLVKHADDVSVKVGGTSESLSPNAKARLKQFLSDPDAGNPWKLDVPDDFPDDAQFPIPHNYWARGLLIELQQFKKVYKSQGYDHFPNATAYDYKGPKFVQMKSVADPTSAGSIQRMRKAIDRLALAAGDQPMVLHVAAPNDNFTAMRAALLDYVEDKTYVDRIEIVIEKITFP